MTNTMKIIMDTARTIVDKDMGARKQAEYIKKIFDENFNGYFELLAFTAEVSEMVHNLMDGTDAWCWGGRQ